MAILNHEHVGGPPGYELELSIDGQIQNVIYVCQGGCGLAETEGGVYVDLEKTVDIGGPKLELEAGGLAPAGVLFNRTI